MVKSLTNIEEIIFNYLDREERAVFFAMTDLYVYDSIKDGVTWVQSNAEKEITAFVVTGEKDSTVVFARENADFEELSFILTKSFFSPNILPFKSIDKKYLLYKNDKNATGEKGINYLVFDGIKALDSGNNRDVVERKMYYHLKGLCEGALMDDICGGFINFAPDFSVITDVFVRENQRGKGHGRLIVNKLLKLSKYKDVYLISREHNLNFYEKIGFKTAKKIYEYKIEV